MGRRAARHGSEQQPPHASGHSGNRSAGSRPRAGGAAGGGRSAVGGGSIFGEGRFVDRHGVAADPRPPAAGRASPCATDAHFAVGVAPELVRQRMGRGQPTLQDDGRRDGRIPDVLPEAGPMAASTGAMGPGGPTRSSPTAADTAGRSGIRRKWADLGESSSSGRSVRERAHTDAACSTQRGTGSPSSSATQGARVSAALRIGESTDAEGDTGEARGHRRAEGAGAAGGGGRGQATGTAAARAGLASAEHDLSRNSPLAALAAHGGPHGGDLRLHGPAPQAADHDRRQGPPQTSPTADLSGTAAGQQQQ